MPSLDKLSASFKSIPRQTPPPHFRALVTSPLHQSQQCLSSRTPTYFSHNTLFLHLRSSRSLDEAIKLHALMIVHGSLSRSPVLGAQLVHSYVNFDCHEEALLVFNHIPRKNSFAWNSAIKGLVNSGQFAEALAFYHSMIDLRLEADNFTYPLVLKACAELPDLEQGRRIQELIQFDAESNSYVQCALINMFTKCGSLSEAQRVFENMPTRDLVSWGAMICGTVQNGGWLEALKLFRRMRMEGFRLDSVVVATVIPACSRLGALSMGMGLQGCSIKSGFSDDLCVSNALIDLYAKCGQTQTAHRLFQFLTSKDIISWSSLIAGHSQNCQYIECFELFAEMMRLGIKPNSVTIASVLPSLSSLKLFEKGKEIHAYAMRHGFEFDIYIATALVDFYSKSGFLIEAQSIFKILSDTDIAIWNSMISGYVFNDDVDSAFQTLRQIPRARPRPNSVTVISILPLCNRFTMLNHGKELHCFAIRGGLSSIITVSNSLIDMYCKCGCLELGKKVYTQMTNRDIVTYNTIITALGMHGHGDQATVYFDDMNKDKINPDRVTFIALLSACSHAGFIERGLLYYNSMMKDYGILPDMEHYSCMVDLYARSGYLDGAWEFIKNMSVDPDIDVLGSLLGACRTYKRLDLAELISFKIFEKTSTDPGYYVLLSNIYAAAGKWADVKKVRAMIKDKGLMKKPGNSWIQIGCCIHSFVAKDKVCLENKMLQDILKILLQEMKEEGYVPDMSSLHILAENDQH
ncbi:pentatricopeptide repeat-containing protein [Canna indica]|uniref:Pentatricopeptide repeat-containing protein n=1 Tax=Canna indica TaxID=4628 RepID=A0AAQ3KJB6_9LILI|nr:pentatricopeptide repeat-containing protein [Canna indica]